jgi:hypothetical protein
MIPDYLKLPPLLAIKFLKEKLSLPIDYKGLDARLHDYAFMISGLMRADMLESTKDLLIKALEEGTSAKDFANSLQGAIAGSGWNPSGKQVKLIFSTNINNVHWQGQKAKMSTPAMLKARPLWLWIWRDSVHERIEHKKLNNVAIYADNPFWEEISFPCGFGCRCNVYPITEDYAKRHGIRIMLNPPDISLIVDKGFRRGTDVKTKLQIVETGMQRLSPDLKTQFKRELRRRKIA